MGKCMKESVKIHDYLDKLMDAKQKGLLYFDLVMERHFEECEECRQKLKQEQQLFSELSNLQSIEPPKDFTAQLMKRVASTPNYPARQPIPLVGIVVMLIIALMSTVSLVGGGLWLWGNEKVLNYLQAITDPFINQAWIVIYTFGDFLSSLLSILSGFAQFIWLLVEVFPITSGVIILIPVGILPIIIKLINNFQRENYA